MALFPTIPTRGVTLAIILVTIVPIILFYHHIVPFNLKRGGNNNSTNDDDVVVTTAQLLLPSSLDYLNSSRNKSQLAKETLTDLLNQSLVVRCNNTNTHTISTCTNMSFIAPCGVVGNTSVMESTSSLLVATALTKADNLTLNNHTYNLWYYFNALFAVPSMAGFLPKYSYLTNNNRSKDDDDDGKNDNHDHQNYVANTRIPNWNMFFSRNNRLHKNNSTQPLPCDSFKDPTKCWLGSGRVSTTPFHGTALLELVLSLERKEDKIMISHGQLDTLYKYWNRIFTYHEFLHEIVMRGCTSSITKKGGYNQSNAPPCYNIVHPWESMINVQAPIWKKEVLRPAMTVITHSNWTVPFDIPNQVKESYDYDPDVYAATIFLNECLSNQTRGNETAGEFYPYQYQQDNDAEESYENRIVQRCPFAMLDVGFASALAQSDEDLRRVALWLRQRDVASNFQFHKFVEWRDQSRYVMKLLWNKNERSFLPRYALPKKDSNSDDSFPIMTYAKTPIANNLMVFWQQLNGDEVDESGKQRWDSGTDDRMHQMAQYMLHHDGKSSFDCQGIPLWSGGCSDLTSIIDPIQNFFVGVGLSRNRESLLVFGDYITNATIDLILPNTSASVVATGANNPNFYEAFPAAAKHTHLALDQCGATSTSTAAIFYQLLVDDFDFVFELPIPPIRNSWILTLISLELLFAFTVGVSCICLSLGLVRQENSSQEQDEEGAGGGTYLAVDSDGADNDEESDSMPGLQSFES